MRFLLCQQRGDDFSAQVLPARRITKKGRHIDQNGVKERDKLLRMHFEVIHIIVRVLKAQRLQALTHPTLQARTLITGKVKATIVLEVLEEGFKLLSGIGLIRRDTHSASPLITSVTRAVGISSRGRIKSTLPLWMAALGIPKNSADSSSWAMTVPPIFLMACTPMAPSLPVPVSTTAMARSR